MVTTETRIQAMENSKKIQSVYLCTGHTRPVVSLQWSSLLEGQTWIVSACKDGKHQLRTSVGDWVGTFEGHKGAVWDVCFDSTASRVGSSSADFSAKLWDSVSGKQLQSYEHKHVVRSIALSSDMSTMLTGCQESKRHLQYWDLERTEEPTSVLSSSATVHQVEYLMGSTNTCIASSQNGKFSCFDLRSGDETKSFEFKDLYRFEQTLNGKYIIVCSGQTVSFLDSKTMDVVKDFKLDVPIEDASLHPSLPLFAAGGVDNWLRVVSFETGDMLECHKGHHGPIHTVRYAPDGHSVASGSEDGTIRIWNHFEHGQNPRPSHTGASAS